MKLLFQSDDYGITEGVTCGILKGIRDGLIRNTGMFANMPSSAYAAAQIKDYPQCCFGIDINLVAGSPVSAPQEVPSLVKENGEFYTSGEVRAKSRPLGRDGMTELMEEDPYPLEETLLEVENQVKRFMELSGKKPGYIHPHSLMTPNTLKAIKQVGEKYELPFSMELMQKLNFHWVTNTTNMKPFPLEKQAEADVEANFIKYIPEVLEHEYSAILCHAGYVDEDIFRCSTYTIIRAKDLFMACSPVLKEFVKAHDIELITYNDLPKA